MVGINRPHLTAIFAMTADGKIADRERSPASFGSAADKAHLREQVAAMDAIIFGASTLRVHGASMVIRDPELLEKRKQSGQTPQPFHFVCSGSGAIAKDIRFFEQPIPRGLITTAKGKEGWEDFDKFDQILELDSTDGWLPVLEQLHNQGIKKIGLLGGAQLLGSFVDQGLLDELSLTLCPLVFGGATAPTWCGGTGILETDALKLELLSSKTVESEIFLHYRVVR